MPDIVGEAFELARVFGNHKKETNEEVNIKVSLLCLFWRSFPLCQMLSPRFAPLLPDKLDSRGLLSPSILSFYKDEGEDQIVPIPSLLQATGMSESDKDSMLEMIMEVSGARTTVDKAFEVL